MKTLTLDAKTRDKKNTRAARAYRADGRVPGILYGGALPDGKANHGVSMLTVSKEDLNLLLAKHSLLIDLNLDGKKEVAILKEVQRDVFGEFVMHVDFERVDLKKPITVEIVVHYKGLPKGALKGGQLRIEAHKLEIQALPLEIPEEIVVKIDDMDLDQVFRLKDLALPKGVKALADPEQVLCAVRPPVEEKEPEPGAAAEGPAEPEVIGRKKDEEGEEGAEEGGDKKAGGEKKDK